MANRRFSDLGLILIGLLFAVLVLLGYVVRQALLLIFVSMVFAVVFSPLVNWIQRWRVRKWSPGRGAAILILLVMVVGAIGTFLALALPPIVEDTQALVQDLPTSVHAVQQKISSLPFGQSLAARLNVESFERAVRGVLQQVFGIFKNVSSGVVGLLTLVLLTAYFILDGRRVFEWAMSMVPPGRRRRLATTLLRSRARVQRWLYGQLMLMLILGGASALVFGLLGIRYFYALAVFAAVANFVPILGPLVTLIVAGVVAAIDSWTKLLGVFIFYFVYQQVENAYLTPRIMRSAVGLPGIAIIAALTIGGELAGLLGAIVAVPTAAFLATIIQEYLVYDHAESAQEYEHAHSTQQSDVRETKPGRAA